MNVAIVRRLEAPWQTRSTLGTVIAAVLLALGIAAFVVVGVWRAPIAERVETAEELSQRAGPIVAEVFSASSASWAADRARARSAMTPELASALAAGLANTPPAGVRSVRWEPVSVGVVDAARGAGTALVVADVVVTQTDGTQAADTKSVTADFVESGGRWLLSGVDELQ